MLAVSPSSLNWVLPYPLSKSEIDPESPLGYQDLCL
jgi:hypothetical protein